MQYDVKRGDAAGALERFGILIMKLGFVGTGTIAAAMIEGLCSARTDLIITVSPRNATIASKLAAKFPNVRVAATNQVVLDTSDIIVLAIRPQIADSVIRALHFRQDHHVISLIAAVSHAYLAEAASPASTVTRAVPIPSVARGQGPTAFYPPDPTVRALFDAVGTAIELDDERQFHAFTAGTAMMASYFKFAQAIASWMADNGVPPEKAHAYVGQMLLGLAGNWVATPERDFSLLAEEHQTRGGLNEQVLNVMTENGAFESITRALDSIKARLLNAQA